MQTPQHEPTEPRIIKKKKVAEGGHGGAWKVAYADFVTAMMALFIVLWIMGQSQSIRNNVAQYFKNPGLLPGSSGVMETSDMGGEIPTPGHSQEIQTPSPINPDLASDKGALEEVKKRLSEVIAQTPELNRLKEQVELEITDDGLRIELLERENSHFFDIGSANLKVETKGLLALIAQELGKLPNRLTIEGHTDSRPYGSQSYTNWELSADRANAARRVLETAGLKPSQVMAVRGCADQQLRRPQDPLDPQNRRVSIIVNFQDKAKPLPQGKTPDVWDNLQKVKEKTRPPDSPAPATAPPGDPAGAANPGAKPGGAGKPKEEGPTGSTPGPPGRAIQNTASAAPLGAEEQVREEVKRLFEGQSPPGSPGNSVGAPAGARERLGW